MVLSGWKEIAQYLHCGIRSAQRWAHSEALPIHRPLQEQKRGPVIAISEDLDEWVRKDRGKHFQSNSSLQHHQQILARLARNIAEQQHLIELLRTERMRKIYQRHQK